MREIKFRAWDLENYNMYFSDQQDDDEVLWSFIDGKPCFSVLETIHSIQGGEHHESARYIEPKQELMQYTGLKDKNGVEIYEGDILRVPYNNVPNTEVKFKYGRYNIAAFDLGRCFVIGNIHQNHELLA